MHSFERSRLALAVGAAAAVILSSPFVGDLRSALLAAFPAQFQLIVAGAIGAAVVVALVVALLNIRSRWRWRMTGLALAVGGAVLYARLVATGNLLVDVVEHVHFVEYGGVAWLFYRASRQLDEGRAIAWPLINGALTGIVDESVQWFIPGTMNRRKNSCVLASAAGSSALLGLDSARSPIARTTSS